jgi:hypothetical protein
MVFERNQLLPIGSNKNSYSVAGIFIGSNLG